MSGSDRGDTLIEVMMAISIMAIVMVGSFSLMNKGVASMYDSLEISMVQNLINRQSESLYYARDQYLARLNGVTLSSSDSKAADLWSGSFVGSGSISDWSGATANSVPKMDDCTDASRAFFIRRDASGSYIEAVRSGISVVASGFPSPGNGLWIQKKSRSSAEAAVPYKDFYIKACWLSSGGGSVPQKLSTIVRLYDRS